MLLLTLPPLLFARFMTTAKIRQPMMNTGVKVVVDGVGRWLCCSICEVLFRWCLPTILSSSPGLGLGVRVWVGLSLYIVRFVPPSSHIAFTNRDYLSRDLKAITLIGVKSRVDIVFTSFAFHLFNNFNRLP